MGNHEALDKIIEAQPKVFNHNVETVRLLSPRVRHKATYERSLEVLSYVHEKAQGKVAVKSGLMLGLGESEEMVKETLHDLKTAGCSIVTMGQYLQPSHHKLLVKAFIPPEQFDFYADYGRKIGITQVFAGPFVRSSYHAAEQVTS
jgi:lipoic acid synthetase